MITEQMIKDREFDKLVAMTIATWAGYAKKDNMGLIIVGEAKLGHSFSRQQIVIRVLMSITMTLLAEIGVLTHHFLGQRIIWILCPVQSGKSAAFSSLTRVDRQRNKNSP